MRIFNRYRQSGEQIYVELQKNLKKRLEILLKFPKVVDLLALVKGTPQFRLGYRI